MASSPKLNCVCPQCGYDLELAETIQKDGLTIYKDGTVIYEDRMVPLDSASRIILHALGRAGRPLQSIAVADIAGWSDRSVPVLVTRLRNHLRAFSVPVVIEAIRDNLNRPCYVWR